MLQLVVGGTSSTGCLVLQLLKSLYQPCVVTVVPYRAVPLARLLGADFVVPSMPDHEDTEEKCAAELMAHQVHGGKHHILNFG